jgi:hypothetical protein
VRHAIDSRKRKLDNFFKRADDRSLEEEMVSDLSKFGAVLICGYVEKCVEVIVLERLKSRAHPRVMAFLKSHFRRGTNYDCKTIVQLLNRFDPDWAERFQFYCAENDKHAESLDSAYALRNSIAHGGDANRGLTGIRELYSSAQAIIDALIDATA